MAQVEVTVIEATNLKQKDKLKKNDCYIRIHLNDQKRKTTTIKNSNDPQWNEIFVFDNVKQQDVLYVNIYAEDQIKNKKIGCIQIKLHNLHKKGHIDNWFHIIPEGGLACYGQVHLILDCKN